jgi:pre-rRNA-processing protein TSR3
MSYFPPTIILRHNRENLKKCSLRGLEGRDDMVFLSYPEAVLPDLKNYSVLTLDAPPLSQEDAALGLFLIDGTWAHAKKMAKILPSDVKFRSLPPHFKTAYPRRQLDDRGLASIEALYIAYHLLERKTGGLLDGYYWKESFISTNFPTLS